MNPLDHASAHEIILDLALEPGTLDRLGDAIDAAGTARHADTTDPGWAALIEHLAVCADCRREAEAARRTDDAIRSTVKHGGLGVELAATEGLDAAPASLRAAVAAIPRRSVGAVAPPVPARREDVPTVSEHAHSSRRVFRNGLVPRPRLVGIVGLAAALVVAAVGSIAIDASNRATNAAADRAHLQAVVVDVERILSAPAHRTVPLRAADGSAAGTIAWTDSDIAVVATGLSQPSAGASYRCWIERGGVRTAIGEMDVVGGIASWVGEADAWGTVALSGGGRFEISLETDATGTSGPVVLTADLPA